MKVLLLVQLLFHIFLETDACAELRLTSEDNSVVVGRSMEWSMDLLSHFIVEPKGKQHIATLKQGCIPVQGRLKWTNLYDVAYLDAWQSLYATDGMNSAGLSVGSLFLPKFTEYQVTQNTWIGEHINQYLNRYHHPRHYDHHHHYFNHQQLNNEILELIHF